MISQKYEKRDRERGIPATFAWFIEEVGELATAFQRVEDEREPGRGIRRCPRLALYVANISEVDLEKACVKYTAKKSKALSQREWHEKPSPSR